MRILPLSLAVTFMNLVSLNVAQGSVAEHGSPMCFREAPTIVGTAGDDVLIGGPGHDVIVGLGGHDRIDARGGLDMVCGGPGADIIRGGDTGIDDPDLSVTYESLDGGDGDDVLRGERGLDLLIGGPGDDLLNGGPHSDWAGYARAPRSVDADLRAGTASGWGSDTLIAVENLVGSRYGDHLAGDDEINMISAWAGSDVVFARGGNDYALYGGTGHDMIDGGRGHDSMLGQDGRDRMFGRRSDDAVQGGTGDDYLNGGKGSADEVQPGRGFDFCVHFENPSDCESP